MWAVAVLIVSGLGLLGLCITCLYLLLLRSERRYAQRVLDLKATTPPCNHTGGPTQYDNHGRVTY